VHVSFEVEGCHSFMKGIIDGHDDVSGKFHISFFDGDEIDTDLASDGDVVLWETGDITMDASWPPSDSPRAKKEPENAAKNVDQKAVGGAKDLFQSPIPEKRDDVGEIKDDAVEIKRKIKPVADGMENDKDNQSEEIEIDDKDEETESAEVVGKPPESSTGGVSVGENAESKVHSAAKPTSSGKKSRDEDKKQKNVTIGRVSQALGMKRLSSARDEPSKKSKVVNSNATKALQEKKEPKMVTKIAGAPEQPEQPKDSEMEGEPHSLILKMFSRIFIV